MDLVLVATLLYPNHTSSTSMSQAGGKAEFAKFFTTDNSTEHDSNGERTRSTLLVQTATSMYLTVSSGTTLSTSHIPRSDCILYGLLPDLLRG